MILLIDNYDSFSYNLYQLVGSIDPNIRVERNDALAIEDIRQLKPSHIILSPGPGRPEDAGICEAVVRELQERSRFLVSALVIRQSVKHWEVKYLMQNS